MSAGSGSPAGIGRSARVFKTPNCPRLASNRAPTYTPHPWQRRKSAVSYTHLWGLPITWQGWTVLGLWFAAVILGRRYLIPHTMFAHLAFALAMVFLLLSICYKKGAPPGWRFGNRD